MFILPMLVTACNHVSPASTSYAISSSQTSVINSLVEDLPRLDGSTANIPLANLMLSRITTKTNDEIAELTNFTTTPNAYDNLANGNTDLLLVYEADEATKENLKQSNIELEYHAIGKDALVFLTNEGNPVQSLTTKQIQDIYQGKISNWKIVGGNDMKIVAYQRAARSGSQALMVKLVMKELTMMKAPIDLYPAEMGGLIDALASYNNSKNAIGYSVYYYAKNMYSQPGLKFITVNGIAPDNETIASSAYPFINEFYAVIRKNELPNSPARKMLQWILSDEGIKTITDAGYVCIAR